MKLFISLVLFMLMVGLVSAGAADGFIPKDRADLNRDGFWVLHGSNTVSFCIWRELRDGGHTGDTTRFHMLSGNDGSAVFIHAKEGPKRFDSQFCLLSTEGIGASPYYEKQWEYLSQEGYVTTRMTMHTLDGNEREIHMRFQVPENNRQLRCSKGLVEDPVTIPQPGAWFYGLVVRIPQK